MVLKGTCSDGWIARALVISTVAIKLKSGSDEPKEMATGGMEIADSTGGIGMSIGGIDIGARMLGVDGSGIAGQVVPSPSASTDRLKFAVKAACCRLPCNVVSLRSMSWLGSLEE